MTEMCLDGLCQPSVSTPISWLAWLTISMSVTSDSSRNHRLPYQTMRFVISSVAYLYVHCGFHVCRISLFLQRDQNNESVKSIALNSKRPCVETIGMMREAFEDDCIGNT